jgi:hypothetical protein
MKEFFIIKRISKFRFVDFYTGIIPDRSKTVPDITATKDISKAYRHDTYEDSLTTIKNIAKPDNLYQIESFFVATQH